MLKLLGVFFACLVFTYSEAMLSEFRDRINGKGFVHVITLSRAPCAAGSADVINPNDPTLVKYPLITALESATVFSVVNWFLGGDVNFDHIAHSAKEFDNRIYEEYRKLSQELILKTPVDKKPVILQALLRDLIIIFPDNEAYPNGSDFRNGLAERISEYFYTEEGQKVTIKADIIKPKSQILLVRDNGARLYRLALKQNGNTLLRNKKATLDAGKLKECLLEPAQIKCIGDSEALEQEEVNKLISAIKAAKNINDIVISAQIGEREVTCSQLAAIEGVFAKNPELIFRRSFFHRKLLEMQYGAISPSEFKDIQYYKKIYDFLKGRLKYRINSSEACLFVTNELFFGKDTVWPSTFQSIIPPSPSNVISCINFLMGGIGAQEDRIIFQNPQPTDKELLFYSETHSDLPYRSHHNTSELPIFRNASRFFHSSVLLSEYIKSSYFMESETALDFGHAYLFGSRKNKRVSDSPFTDLVLQKISNQICRDLVCGVRIGQDAPQIPIHIIQSNTLDIHPYIFDPLKVNYVPGKPNIIVHADPLWSEVLIASHDDKIDFLPDTLIPVVHADTMKYKNARSVYEFKFSLPKEGYVDCYTITHWVLNAESPQYRSFPLE